MMKVLIVSAMNIENECMSNALLEAGYSYDSKNMLYSNGRHVVGLCTAGIGKVNSAVATSSAIFLFNPDLVISQGCCACVEGLNVGDVFYVDKAYQYDFTLEPIGYSKGQIPMGEEKYLGFESAGVYPKGAPLGDMLTADRFCVGKEEFVGLPVLKNVVGADMETAAIFQACKIMATKAIGVRGVSDVVGSEDQAKDYSVNEKLACEAASAEVVRVLASL